MPKVLIVGLIVGLALILVGVGFYAVSHNSQPKGETLEEVSLQDIELNSKSKLSMEDKTVSKADVETQSNPGVLSEKDKSDIIATFRKRIDVLLSGDIEKIKEEFAGASLLQELSDEELLGMAKYEGESAVKDVYPLLDTSATTFTVRPDGAVAVFVEYTIQTGGVTEHGTGFVAYRGTDGTWLIKPE
jgi:hypothetical protein